MTDPTGLDLDALAALCEAATAGPWIRSGVRQKLGDADCLRVGRDPDFMLAFIPIGHTYEHAAGAMNDAAFIAAARTALPQALATIRALQAEVARLNSGDGIEWVTTETLDKLQARVGELAAIVQLTYDTLDQLPDKSFTAQIGTGRQSIAGLLAKLYAALGQSADSEERS